MKKIIVFILLITTIGMRLDAQVSSKLQPANIIGTSESVDYSDFSLSTTVNTIADAFDGNLDSYFASFVRSGGWVGLDLGEKHVITRIAYCPRKDQASRLLLGVFEGANNPDFGDAIPIFFIKEAPEEDKLTEQTVNCTRGFRYVRYVGPDDVRCNIAEIEFYGYAANGNDEQLYQVTGLPNVIIHTKNAEDIVQKEVYLKGIISFISEDGKKIYTDSTEIRGRGNASWGFPKKPYRIKLFNKTNVLGLPAKAKNWTLINNYGDKTLMRNYLAFDLSERYEMSYTPAIKFVNVFLNGEYKGCYQLCDHMEVEDNRVNVETMKPSDTQLPALSGGYLLEIDAYGPDTEPVYFYSNRHVPVTIKYPKDDDIVPAQQKYITDWFNTMEAALFGANYKNPETGYRKYMDMETFIRHFLVGEMSGNTDTYWSVYMYKKRNNDIFYFGPVWDFDIAYENDSRTYPINKNPDWICTSTGSAANNARDIITRLFTDIEFIRQLRSVYAQYRDSGVISEETLLAVIDEAAEQLDESQKLNFIRWDIMNHRVHQNPKVHGGYRAEVDNVRKYVRERIAWMDKKLHYPDWEIINSEQEEYFKDVQVWSRYGALHIEGLTPPVKVEVIAVDGKVLYTQQVQSNSIDISFPSGLYIIRLSDSKGRSKSVKVIIE